MHVYQKNNYSNHKNVNFGWSTIETPPPKSTFEKFVQKVKKVYNIGIKIMKNNQ